MTDLQTLIVIAAVVVALAGIVDRLCRDGPSCYALIVHLDRDGPRSRNQRSLRDAFCLFRAIPDMRIAPHERPDRWIGVGGAPRSIKR
jgi:hypothetical protein